MAHLILLIVSIMIGIANSQIMCVWKSYARLAMNGNWERNNSIANLGVDREWWTNGGEGKCPGYGPNNYRYSWRASTGRWFWGTWADKVAECCSGDFFCSSSTTDPTTEACSAGNFYVWGVSDETIEITLGSCPIMNCGWISINGGGNADCDGIYDVYTVPNGDLNDVNVYKHRAESKYFWFDYLSFRWKCGTDYYPCSNDNFGGKIVYNGAEDNQFGLDTVSPGGSFQITNYGYLTPSLTTATLECEPPAPTVQPTTNEPTISPTTSDPTTSEPTTVPTTSNPTKGPSNNPSQNPTITPYPSSHPTTNDPSNSPTTSDPTKSPSDLPTSSPSDLPTTSSPTTKNPTKSPLDPGQTSSPSKSPTKTPSIMPTTNIPTSTPTYAPVDPSMSPTRSPTNIGETYQPTKSPSGIPTTGDPTTLNPTPFPTPYVRKTTMQIDGVNTQSNIVVIVISMIFLLFVI